MDPFMTNYFKEYQNKLRNGLISANADDKEIELSNNNLQANDIWNIVFLVLLTHNPSFAYSYSYDNQNKNYPKIQFNPIVFKKLMYKVLVRFESDLNFCFVLSKLCNFDWFKDIEKKNGQYMKMNSLNYNQQYFTIRDLRFYIWVLAQSKYPKEKILRFELGEYIQEIDKDDSINSDFSLCEIIEESKNFRKTSYYNYKEITTPSLNDIKHEKSSPISKKKIPTFAVSNKYIESIPIQNTEDKVIKKQENPAKDKNSSSNITPVQEIENIPQFNYNLNKKKESQKTIEITVTNESQSKNSDNFFKIEFKQINNNFSSFETISKKLGSSKSKNIPVDMKNHMFNKTQNKNKYTGSYKSDNVKYSYSSSFKKIGNEEIKTSKKLFSLDSKNEELMNDDSNKFTVKEKIKVRKIISIDQVINNLRKVSLKTKEMTTMNELDTKNDMIFDMPAEKIKSDIKCPCKLCKKVKLRKPKIAINIKTIFKNEKKIIFNPNEIREKKISNRLKRTQKSKEKPLNIINPYLNKKRKKAIKSKKPELKINKQRFNSNIYLSESSKISFTESKKSHFEIHF
jgi:hypothetical protein